MKNERQKSKYAKKHARAVKGHFRSTSPSSPNYSVNPHHRLAIYFARGERLAARRFVRLQSGYLRDEGPLYIDAVSYGEGALK